MRLRDARLKKIRSTSRSERRGDDVTHDYVENDRPRRADRVNAAMHRSFISLLGASAAASPQTASAQQAA
jgi:hypothetical protein